MDKLSKAYWGDRAPKTSKELNKQIKDAVSNLVLCLDMADIKDDRDRVMIEGQLFWLKELLKLSKITLKSIKAKEDE